MLAMLVGAQIVGAQDSSRADWQRWFALLESFAECRAHPLVMRVHGGLGDYTMHRLPDGRLCQAGPGPGQPTAFIIDSLVFCPDSNPDTWARAPRQLASVDLKDVIDIEPVRDTTRLHALDCAIRPRAMIVVRTRANLRRPPGADSSRVSRSISREGVR